jgi:hypothetical protein
MSGVQNVKAKLSLCLIKHYAMKAYGGVEVYIHVFLTSALVGGEWSASRPCRFTPGERDPGTHWIGGWVGPKAGLDDVERRKISPLPGLELRPLGRRARSQSLYRLSSLTNGLSLVATLLLFSEALAMFTMVKKY